MLTFQLHVTGAHWIRVDPALDLSSRMRNLPDNQAAMLLPLLRHLLEHLESLPRELRLQRHNGVSCRLQLVVINHDVSS
jgi:hypothetical protein